MDVVKYNEKYKKDFIQFSYDWIEGNFGALEKEDIYQLEHIEDYLKQSGMVFFAIENETVLACCMVIKVEDDIWEICKLCSNKNVEHKGAGSAVFSACIDWAKQNNAKKISVVSNRKLKPALHIYKKFGFVEIKQKDNRYSRGDIELELNVKD